MTRRRPPRGESSTPGQLARCHMCTHEIHTGGAKAGLIQRVVVPGFKHPSLGHWDDTLATVIQEAISLTQRRFPRLSRSVTGGLVTRSCTILLFGSGKENAPVTPAASYSGALRPKVPAVMLDYQMQIGRRGVALHPGPPPPTRVVASEQ